MRGKRKYRMSLISSKKGVAMDLIIIPVIIVMVAMVWLVFVRVSDQATPLIIDAVNETGVENPVLDKFSRQQDRYGTILDRAIMFMMFGFASVALIAAFFVRQHPIFYWSIVMLMIVFGLVNMIFSNVYQEFADQEALQSASDQMPITFYLMEWLPFIMLGISGLLVVAQYMKPVGAG